MARAGPVYEMKVSRPQSCGEDPRTLEGDVGRSPAGNPAVARLRRHFDESAFHPLELVQTRIMKRGSGYGGEL
jgi:hypothetical protein